MLPNPLKKALEEEVLIFLEKGGSAAVLKEGQKQLHQTYQKELLGRHGQETVVKRYAYLLTRFPATYHAVAHVLKGIEGQGITSCVDVGAGSLASSLAAAFTLPSLEKITSLEQDANLLAIGQGLLQKMEQSIQRKVHPICQRISSQESLPASQLVLFSYSLGEMEGEEARKIVRNAFFATEQWLVIVEPGTPRGFQRILAMRQELLELGGHLVAPCPHAWACPMSTGDWCHFSVRLERSFWHRYVKGAHLGYEDEKYCYLLVSKQAATQGRARVLSSPEKHGGHVRMKLCTSDGKIQEKLFSKKCGLPYQAAKKISWGDAMQ